MEVHLQDIRDRGLLAGISVYPFLPNPSMVFGTSLQDPCISFSQDDWNQSRGRYR